MNANDLSNVRIKTLLTRIRKLTGQLAQSKKEDEEYVQFYVQKLGYRPYRPFDYLKCAESTMTGLGGQLYDELSVLQHLNEYLKLAMAVDQAAPQDEVATEEKDDWRCLRLKDLVSNLGLNLEDVLRALELHCEAVESYLNEHRRWDQLTRTAARSLPGQAPRLGTIAA